MKKGQFILEYVGEVISTTECEYRLKTHYANEKNFYMLTIDANSVIDATRLGGIGRFTNHSCDPNCETQKWTVDGRARIGIFALKDLKIGDELTFDYRFERFGGKKEKCHCGAKNCRGYLGAKASKKTSSVSESSNKEALAEEDAESQLVSGCINLLAGLDNTPSWDSATPPFLVRNLHVGLAARKDILKGKVPQDLLEKLQTRRKI